MVIFKNQARDHRLSLLSSWFWLAGLRRVRGRLDALQFLVEDLYICFFFQFLDEVRKLFLHALVGKQFAYGDEAAVLLAQNSLGFNPCKWLLFGRNFFVEFDDMKTVLRGDNLAHLISVQ